MDTPTTRDPSTALASSAAIEDDLVQLSAAKNAAITMSATITGRNILALLPIVSVGCVLAVPPRLDQPAVRNEERKVSDCRDVKMSDQSYP